MTISQTLTTAMFEEETLDGLLVLLTINHSTFTVPIRVVHNQENIHRHDTVNSLADHTANANIAVFTGSPTFVTGLSSNGAGKAVNFEPADHASFGSGTEFDLGSFTFEFWLEPEALDAVRVLMVREVASTKGYQITVDTSGELTFKTTSSGGTLSLVTATAPLAVLGTAVHVAFTYDLASTTGRIVINGATVKSGSGALIVPDGQDFRINGTLGGSSGFDGTYDEFRVWNFARSDAVILRDLNRRNLGTEAGLVGYWPWSGFTEFVGLPFEIILPADEAGSPPSAKLGIDNVSTEITAAIRLATGTPPTVQIDVVRILDNDAVELTFPPLKLRNVRANVAKVTGDLFSEDLQTEPFPADNFTPGAFPGLF